MQNFLDGYRKEAEHIVHKCQNATNISVDTRFKGARKNAQENHGHAVPFLNAIVFELQ